MCVVIADSHSRSALALVRESVESTSFHQAETENLFHALGLDLIDIKTTCAHSYLSSLNQDIDMLIACCQQTGPGRGVNNKVQRHHHYVHGDSTPDHQRKATATAAHSMLGHAIAAVVTMGLTKESEMLMHKVIELVSNLPLSSTAGLIDFNFVEITVTHPQLFTLKEMSVLMVYSPSYFTQYIVNLIIAFAGQQYLSYTDTRIGVKQLCDFCIYQPALWRAVSEVFIAAGARLHLPFPLLRLWRLVNQEIQSCDDYVRLRFPVVQDHKSVTELMIAYASISHESSLQPILALMGSMADVADAVQWFRQSTIAPLQLSEGTGSPLTPLVYDILLRHAGQDAARLSEIIPYTKSHAGCDVVTLAYLDEMLAVSSITDEILLQCIIENLQLMMQQPRIAPLQEHVSELLVKAMKLLSSLFEFDDTADM